METNTFEESTSPDFIAISHDYAPSRTPSPDFDEMPTPTPRRASYDLKRNAVPVACLRCRRRKVRCSGLPGPCVTCAKFSVACIDPGKRRSRSRSAADARSPDFLAPQQVELDILQPTPISSRPMRLHLQTTNIWDDTALHMGDDLINYPVSPACYSDMGPELDPNWLWHTGDGGTSCFSSLSRAQTFPQQLSVETQELQSPIPSIQITSHNGSPMSSPMLQPTFDLPIREAQEELPPLQMPISTPMDYYSDYLSPTDQPPPISRRASVSFGNNTSHVADWTQKTAPAKRRHTTCSLTNPRTVENTELTWMLNSPRTTSYLKHYMEVVHPRYPFLSPQDRSHANASPFAETSTGIKTYKRLLMAGIGAALQHQSRDIAARYVRHAMSVQKREDLEFFASISGIHCAMLLAIYLLREGDTPFEREEEDVSHPDVNLWLWSCRIAASCVDLGLHQWPDGEEPALATLCMTTFEGAWVLDREISQQRKRPRALHTDDIDPNLLAWLLEREVERSVRN